MSERTTDIGRFYDVLDSLAARLGGPRILRECDGRMEWPQRGVYFFFEDGETRSGSRTGSRVVRVGTHALKNRSHTTLWKRLSQHRGSARSGGGSHRGSVYRLLVGAALAGRGDLPLPRFWGERGHPQVVDRAARKRGEADLEALVSRTIGAMPFLWLSVGDPPGPDSQRGIVERNAIALLSNYAESGPDSPSSGWLGHHSDRERVCRSGLWNNNHVDETYDPSFLDVLEELVEETPRS